MAVTQVAPAPFFAQGSGGQWYLIRADLSSSVAVPNSGDQSALQGRRLANHQYLVSTGRFNPSESPMKPPVTDWVDAVERRRWEREETVFQADENRDPNVQPSPETTGDMWLRVLEETFSELQATKPHVDTHCIPLDAQNTTVPMMEPS
jgi:hypothetical protein